MGVMSTATLFFGTVKSIMDKLPGYDQKLRAEYADLLLQFNAELNKKFSERDDDLILNLYDELNIQVVAFSHALNKVEFK